MIHGEQPSSHASDPDLRIRITVSSTRPIIRVCAFTVHGVTLFKGQAAYARVFLLGSLQYIAQRVEFLK